jgi:hypothetical protein
MGVGKISLKKILVMSFDDSFLPSFTKIIFKKVITIPEDIGFYNLTNKDNSSIYTFLSSKIRRIWIHHFIGTHGIIILYEGEESKDNISEIMSILSNSYLENVPVLFIMSKKLEKDYDYLEKLRFNLYVKSILFNIIFINFDVRTKENELFYGIDWLQDNLYQIQTINSN